MVIFIKDTFNGGIRLGGLTSSLDIKLLVCLILIEIKDPLTSEQITQIINDESLANYFDVMTAISELIKNNYILNDENNFLTVTESGKDDINALIHTLPISIKERALVSANKFVLNNKKLNENKVVIKQNKDGYTVQCKMLDIGSDLLNIELFVGTLTQAKEVEETFLNNPKKVYETVLNTLIRK